MPEEKRYCRLCDIVADIPQDVGEYAQKLYDLLPPGERAGEEMIRSRLDVCAACPKLSIDTCLACGCYVLIRTSAKSSRCPKKRW